MSGKLIARVSVAAVAVFIVAAGAVFAGVALHRDGARIQTLEKQDVQARRQFQNLQSEIAGVSGQLATLSKPTDPLSAYDQICNQQMTNDATGVTQTYYFPCTNSAQTIPQPGS